MKIKLLTAIVGSVCHQAGETIDVTESDALSMAAAGHCEIVTDPETVETAQESVVETGAPVESQEPAVATETNPQPAPSPAPKTNRKKFG